MSSTFKVVRICEHCKNEFEARTTITRYCSHRCNRSAYKAALRQIKIDKSNEETQRKKNQPVEHLKSREFLTVTQVSHLIGCSRQNIYNLINTGRLKATNILVKKTIIHRGDLDEFFRRAANNSKPLSTHPATDKQ